MKDLIQKLEAATEGSRELDVAIWNAIYPRATTPELPKGYFPVTTSLDAAMSLVPEGHDIKIAQASGPGRTDWYAYVQKRSDYGNEPLHGANTSAPALALCIAALRARVGVGEGE